MRVCTFCGHSKLYSKYEIVKQKCYTVVESLINSGYDEFLVGDYGQFDTLAAVVCLALRNKYPHITVSLVLPFYRPHLDDYTREQYAKFDTVITPELEDVPHRLRIIKANQYMVDQSDTVIAYVKYDGGAAKTLACAYNRHKQIINIGEGYVMALITCPECGKQISDKAPACIHCGYPLQEQPPINNTASSASNSKKVAIPSFATPTPQKIPAIKVVREITGMSLAEAKDFVEQNVPYLIVKDGLSDNQANLIAHKFREVNVDARIFDSSAPVSFVNPQKDKDVICCPQCGSTQYHAGARGFSLVTGFIGSGKTVLTCLQCGHRWKPGR